MRKDLEMLRLAAHALRDLKEGFPDNEIAGKESIGLDSVLREFVEYLHERGALSEDDREIFSRSVPGIARGKQGLNPFKVSLHEDRGDKHQIVFECWAEDAEHACDQATDAYPHGEILVATPVDLSDCVQLTALPASPASSEAMMQELQELKKEGLGFSACIEVFGERRENNPYATAVFEADHVDGELEVDDVTVVSMSDDGAYVMSWIWVSDDEVGIARDEDHGKTSTEDKTEVT